MLAVRKICLISSLFFAVAFLFLYQSKANANKIFGNMTYFTSCPYISERVSLVNGYNVVWNNHFHVSLYYEGHYIYGDFNHDGLKDAAAIIGESQGGSDDEVSLAFLIYDGKKFVHEKSVYLGDSVIINSLKENNGKVIVDLFVHQEGDCNAGPTNRVRNICDLWPKQ